MNRCLTGLVCGCAVVAFAGTAKAQTISPSSGTASAGVAEGGDPQLNSPQPRGASQEPTAVQEVVVTAQKREQRLQDVPVTVSVIQGEELKKQGITNASQLQYTAPELNFVAGPSPSYSIRGIGTQSFSATASTDVSVVVDGVIQGQPAPPVNSLFDIQRVEILSGPQGMLFGKNASAGVISIVTNPPDPRAVSFDAHADLGDRSYQVYQGTANLPVTSDSALRVSVFSNSEDSLLHNIYADHTVNPYSNYGARAAYLLNEPAFKLLVIGDYSKQNNNAAEFTVRKAGTLAPILSACGISPSSQNTDVCLDGPVSTNVESYGLSAQIDVPLGAYTLTSITADRQFARYGNQDTDTINLNYLDLNLNTEFDNQFSQELRISSPTHSRFEYVAGLYFYDFNYKLLQEQAGTVGRVPFVLLLRDATENVNEFSYAAFAQGTLHVYRGFNLILGGRETRDISSTNNSFVCDLTAGMCLNGVTAIGQTSGKVAYDNFSYRIGGQYEVSRDSQFYATYTRGYKGPAINTPNNATATSIVRPEFPLYLELGYKGSFFEHRLSVNVSAFHDDIKNFQAQVLDQSVVPALYIFANASVLHSNGVQLDVSAQPFRGLHLDGGLIYNHATYGNFRAQCPALFCVGSYNVQGEQLANAPRWQATLNGEYDHDVTQNLEGYINANVAYHGPTNPLGVPDPDLRIASYAIVNGRIGVRTRDGRYGVALFARNLFDNRFASFVFPDPVSGGGNIDQSFSRDAFRVVGASVDVRY